MMQTLTLKGGPGPGWYYPEPTEGRPTPRADERVWIWFRGRRFSRGAIRKARGALRKADIPTGARWITVHPNGPGTKGTPLLIQEASDGSGTSHVIGGAGGKLNYLRLKPSQRDAAEAHQDAAERRKARQAAKKAKRDQEKTAGTHKAKQQAREEVDSARRVKEDEFIDHVAGAM